MLATSLAVVLSLTIVGGTPKSSGQAKAQLGYWLVTSKGDVGAYGSTKLFSSHTRPGPTAKVVAMAATPDSGGYWLVESTGRVFAFGDAKLYGSAITGHPRSPIAAIAATADGKGYWLVARDGDIFAFGDAASFPDANRAAARSPVVAVTATTAGRGLWLLLQDGQVLGCGSARLFGSGTSRHLRAAFAGMAGAPRGNGYWLVTRAGQVIAFGDARHYGSLSPRLHAVVVGMAATPNAKGYWLSDRDGRVSAFGDAHHLAAVSALAAPTRSVTAIAASGPSSVVARAATSTTATASTTTTYTAPPAPTQAQVCPGGADTSLLQSPYTGSGVPAKDLDGGGVVPYSSGKYAGLPTFGSPGSEFPYASAGYIVAAGNNSQALGNDYDLRSNTLYWLAPGTHTGLTINTDEVGTDAFVGGFRPSLGEAVDSGQGRFNYAFEGNSLGPITVEYLTIEQFDPPNNAGAVNASSAADWALEYDTLEDNTPGTAAYIGNDNVYEHNCFTKNGQEALGSYDEHNASTGAIGAVFEDNEVSYNGLADFPDTTCGCSGGIKFWASTDAVVKDNYIHDNYSVGVWFDTDNTGALIEDNYISYNWNNGLDYEISYNADITGNTFVGNGWGAGSDSAGDFPYGEGIYISNSGGDPNVVSDYQGELVVENNAFTENWNGVIVYFDPNRYCGSGVDGYCTLDDPSVYTLSSCPANLTTSSVSPGAPLPAASATPYDYFDYCQWKSENITVADNTFDYDPPGIADAVGQLPQEKLSLVTDPDYWSGFNGMFAVPGTGANGPSSGWNGPDALMGLVNASHQPSFGNVWQDNTYNGPWKFQAYSQGSGIAHSDTFPGGTPLIITFAQWQSQWGLDKGSTYSK